MKILALERPGATTATKSDRDLMITEAGRVWELYRSGIMREFYFTLDNDAVLILECANTGEARMHLNSLPLVRERRIQFELLPLNPYTGLERLFATSAPKTEPKNR